MDKVNKNTPIIFLDNVSVDYKLRTGSLFRPNIIKGLDGVSIKVMPGKSIGLVGESGCGKSTCANVMCGLQPVTSGKVYFMGDDVTIRNSKKRQEIGRRVSVIFQDSSTALNSRMTIKNQLSDPLLVHKITDKKDIDKRIDNLLEIVGLPNSVLPALPGQLSGGQRQRVAIARALALNPDLIIADEPTSALDVSVRAQILNLLYDLKLKYCLSIVFISHDIQTVKYISDEIVVMNNGKIVEVDTKENIFNSPKDPYTKKLLEATPSLLKIDGKGR